MLYLAWVFLKFLLFTTALWFLKFFFCPNALLDLCNFSDSSSARRIYLVLMFLKFHFCVSILSPLWISEVPLLHQCFNWSVKYESLFFSNEAFALPGLCISEDPILVVLTFYLDCDMCISALTFDIDCVYQKFPICFYALPVYFWSAYSVLLYFCVPILYFCISVYLFCISLLAVYCWISSSALPFDLAYVFLKFLSCANALPGLSMNFWCSVSALPSKTWSSVFAITLHLVCAYLKFCRSTVTLLYSSASVLPLRRSSWTSAKPILWQSEITVFNACGILKFPILHFRTRSFWSSSTTVPANKQSVHYRPTSETPLKWRFADGPIVTRFWVWEWPIVIPL